MKAPRVSRGQLLTYMLIFVAMPVVTFFFGGWLDGALNLPRFPPFPFNLIAGFAVFFTGLAIGIKATRLLYRLGYGLPWGEAREVAQTTKLVTRGLYAYIRNPMVLGYSMLPLGMGLMFRSLGMALSITPIVLLVNVVMVKWREEPGLERRFGDEYRGYRRRTPFLIPDPRLLFSPPALCLGLSLIGLILLAVLTFSPTRGGMSPPYQRQLIGSVFLAICFVGGAAGVYPSKVSSMLHSRASGINPQEEPTEQADSLAFRGHHPPCEGFSSHILSFRGRAYCAGCAGLVAGAAISISVGIPYFFWGLQVGSQEALFWVGFVFVILGLFQHRIDLDDPVVHFLLNVVFVVGPLLLLMAVDGMIDDLLVDSYLLGLVIFLIATRILLSQTDHVKTCSNCGVESCRYSFG